MHKIIFLYKSNSSFSIYFNFIRTKILNIFIKRKIVNYKRDHQLLLTKKKITNNFFSSHAFNFFYYLNKLKPNFDYLEIGSYEGNSSIFISNTFPESNIYCVDNWVKTEEYINHVSFSDIESNFDYNTADHKNIYKIKNNSDNFFLKNKKMFDVIYIDGHHLGSQVYKDCKNAWKFLNNGSYLICDDYIWDFYQNTKDNPCFAINSFLNEITGYYKIQKISNSQIFIKKINS
tara:strand:+ start:2007 stop:2702 length:696 start_codon:yes stop_codon:yes gene_type:complete